MSSRLLLERLHDMAVGVQGRPDRRMTQSVGNHLWMRSGSQGDRGVRVPHVVHPDDRQAGGAGERLEPAAEAVRTHRRAVFTAEDEPCVLVVRSPGKPLLELAAPVSTKCRDGCGVKRQTSP